MSLRTLLKEKRQERKKLAEQTGELLTKAATEKRDLTAEEDKQWNERHADIDKLAAAIEKLEKEIELDTQLGEPAPDTRTAGREDVSHRPVVLTPEQSEKRDRDFESLAFRAWASGGAGALRGEQRTAYERMQQAIEADPELRALSAAGNLAGSAGAGTAGGYTVPIGFVMQLETALKWYGGIISAADYIDTESGQQLQYPTINDTTNSGEQVSENSAVAGASGGAAEQDPTYGIVNFNAYMLDSSIVLIPVQLLQDSAFNVESYLVDLLKIRLGRRLNSLATTGSGTTTLTGVVTSATKGVSGASASSVTYNELLDLEHSVDPAYRGSDGYGTPRAAFMFTDTTLKAVKKLVDGNSRPLWIAGGVSEGIQNRRPDTLDGFKYWINQDMSNLGSTNKSILFGDFSKFKIRRVRQLQMFRFAERYMEKLQIGFLAYQRYDSNIVDAGTHPIMYLQNSAT